MEKATKIKIDNYLQTGIWKIKRDELIENKQLTEDYFIAKISEYKSNTSLNQKLIKAYLGQSKNYFYIQDELTKFLFNLDQEEFIKLIKFNKLFDADFFSSLIEPVRTSQKVIQLEKEIKIIQKENKKTEKLKKEIEIDLYKYEFYQLLFNLAVWNDYKYIEQIRNNHQNSAINPFYIQSISFILQIKQRQINDNNQIEDIEPQKLQERFLVFLKHYANNFKKWLSFEALMSKVVDIISWQDSLEAYIYQNARLVIFEKDKYFIIPSSPEDEVIWKKNAEQQIYLERFYHNESKKYVPIQQRINPFTIPLNFSHKIEFLFNGIPEKINFNGKTINPYHILLFFEGLSSFHSSRYYEKIIEYSQETSKDNIFQIIIEGIESENLWYKPMMGALNITDIDYFIDRIVGKIRFDIPISKEQIKNIFDFFTYDLENSEDEYFNILEQPFLKLKDKYFYFTTIIVANNPAYIIENRILKQENAIRKNYETTISKNYENVISHIFSKNGFSTKVGVNIPETKNNKKTDIDILVWKNDKLLIVQAKKTYRRLKASEIENYNPQLEKGAEQIDTSIKYIKNNVKNFLKQNNIDIEAEKLKIFGLIISNTPEGNFKTYGENKYPKITATELAIILEDRKNEIIDWQLEAFALFLSSKEKAIERYAKIQPEIIRAAQIIKEKELKLKYNQLKYWKNKEKNVSNLIKAIEGNYLWKDVLNIEMELPKRNATQEELKAYYLFFEGKHFFELKNYKKAKSIFEEAYKLNSKDKDIKMYYADSLAETGNKEDAINLYSEIIKDFPNYWLVYNNRATTYQEIHEWRKAYKDYCKVLEIDPTNVQAYLIILDMHQNYQFELPNFSSIEEILRNISTIQDERIQKSLFLFSINDIVKLEKKRTNKKITLDEIFVLIDKFMQIEQHTNNFTKTLEVTNNALNKYPDNTKLISIKAWIYKAQNKITEAIDLCKKTIKKDNSESELWRVLGELYLEKKEFKKAEINFQKAIELDKNNHYAYYDLALIFEKNNKIKDAISELKFATKTERVDWKALFFKQLYLIYKKINDIDNAIFYLKKTIEFGDYKLVEDWELINFTKLQNDNRFNDIYYY